MPGADRARLFFFSALFKLFLLVLSVIIARIAFTLACDKLICLKGV
jgi:hypothetical protein